MNYLFWSQTIIWGFILGYLIILIKKSKKLEREFDILKKELDKKNN